MKYEIHAHLKWKIKSQLSKDKIEQQAIKTINDLLSKSDIPRFEIEIASESSGREAKTLKEFSWNFIKYKIHNKNNSYKVKIGKKKFLAKMNHHRYFLFKENNKCVCCGIEGKKVFIEKSPTDQSPYFNLYAQANGKLILLTKDHIKPKSLGGMDIHSNYQTMCSTCNSLKGHSNMRIVDLASLRKIYDKNRGKNKKQLHEIVEKERIRLTKPWKMNIQKKEEMEIFSELSVKTSSDLSVYKNRDGSFSAKSIFDKADKNTEYVGNIRKNMILESLFVFKDHIECKIGDSTVVFIPRSLLSHIKEKNGTMGNRSE